jgi:phage I-like protein
MNTHPRLVALQCHTKPKAGERLVACSPTSVVIAADSAKDAPLPTSIVWMPKGDHEISAGTLHGGSWTGLVRCDELGASVVKASYERVIARGLRVWLDCCHDDGEAAAWVRGFAWDPALGIVASVEWTSLGEKMLREKRLYSFSPTFWVDWESGRVAGLVEGHAAGGLVNAPAFGAAMPALIAARLAGAENTNVNPAPDGPSGINAKDTAMKELLLQILAALGVKVPDNATEQQLTALVTEHAPKAQNAIAASAKVAELQKQLEAVQAQAAKPENADAIKAMKAELDALVANAKTQKTKNAEAAVQAAVDRGAIKADDTKLREKFVSLIEADESNLVVLAAMPGKTQAQSVVVHSDASQRNAAGNIQVLSAGLVESLKAYAEKKTTGERSAIYANSIGPVLRDRGVILGPIIASNNLGTVYGDLVTQRSLSLLKLSFPELGVISTDFSDAAAQFGQTVVSRVKSIPATSNYVAGTGYTTANAVTTDVPVIINAHKGVEISFNANELASTSRDVFGEQVEGAHYSLGKAFVDVIYAVITTANFTNETVSAVGDFNRTKVQLLRKALNTRGVQKIGRFLLLNPDFADKLGNDASLVSLAAFQKPEIITEGMLPRVSGFQPYEIENMPTTDSLVGFAGTADSLVIATRTPNDYTLAMPGASNGIVGTVTNPDTGITVQLVQFVDHKLAASYWRIAVMFGAAKGNPSSGERLVHTANE